MRKKHNLLIIIILVLFFNQIFAQEKQDSSTVLALLKEANSGNFEGEDLIKLEDAFNLSRKLNFKTGTKKSLKLLIAYHRRKNQIPEELRCSFQLTQILEKESNIKELFQALVNIGKIYHAEGIDSKAIEYYEQAQKLLSGDANDAQLSLWQRLAESHFGEKNYEKATFYYENILNTNKRFDNPKGIVEALQSIVKCTDAQMDFEKSLLYNTQIKEILEKKGEQKYIASIYNNIAINFNHLKNYPKALEYFLYAEKILPASTLPPNVFYTNLGIAYSNNRLIPNAVENLLKAKNLSNKEEEKSNLNHLIATIYLNNNDTYNALLYNKLATDGSLKTRDFTLLSETYSTAALVHQKLYDYEKAFDFYKKHLILKDSLLLSEILRQQSLLQQQSALEKNEKEIKLLLYNQEIQDLTIKQLGIEKERLGFEASKLSLEASERDAQIALLKREEDVRTERLRNTQLEAERSQQSLKLAQQLLLAAKKDKEISKLNAIDKENQIEILEQKNEQDRKKQEIAQLTNEKAFEQRERESFQKNAYRFGLLGTAIIGLLFLGWFFARRLNQKLKAQKVEIEQNNKIIEQEKSKSDELLRNILPEAIAQELKTNGQATSRKYEMVSVLFTDFVNFTNIAETLSPEQLIEELNSYFAAFDQIVERHNLEKIKTIGDAYMCAGGIPTPNQSNPKDAVMAGLEMLEFIHQRNIERTKKNLPPIDIRLGIHTGSVIAGVVGTKKFAYDIWGDAVNVASRMESSGEINKLNVSANTYFHVRDEFSCIFRGNITAKNKGELGMYFVEKRAKNQ
jgi:adenylate cyclase